MAKYVKTEQGYQEIETTVAPMVGEKMDKNNPVGTGSFSMGRKAGSAIGTNSHAEGGTTTASGEYSHAEGDNTTASSYASHAEGSCTKAGNTSHAEGDSTTASGYASHAEGCYTKASGEYSHAEGKYNIEDTANKYAHIIGNGTSIAQRHNCFMVGWDGAIYVQASDDATKMMKLTIKSDGTISAEQVTV